MATTLVRDVMTTDVLSFAPHEPVTQAMRRLVERGVSGGPVVGAGNKVVGMLTDSDLIVQDVQLHAPTVIEILGAVIELPTTQKKFEEELHKAVGMTVGEVMNPDVVSCRADDSIEDAATLMHDRDISRLAVLDGDGRLVGVLARRDILRYLVRGAARG